MLFLTITYCNRISALSTYPGPYRNTLIGEAIAIPYLPCSLLKYTKYRTTLHVKPSEDSLTTTFDLLRPHVLPSSSRSSQNAGKATIGCEWWNQW